MSCKQEEKYYLIGYPETQVFTDTKFNPGNDIRLPYLTAVKLTTKNIIEYGDYGAYEIEYNGKIGYVFTVNVSKKNKPPFVPNIISGKDKLDFEIDKNEVYKKSIDYLKQDSSSKSDVENDLYHLDKPVYFTVSGIGCNNDQIKTIRVVYQSSRYIDQCTIITYHYTNGVIDYGNPTITFTYIDLDKIYNEYKDIRKSYCSD